MKIEQLRKWSAAHRRNAVFLRPDEEQTAGVTRIGGKPLLPADFTFPAYTDAEDGKTRPLAFLAQVDLTEIHPFDTEGLLPDTGILSFFYELDVQPWGYDTAHAGSARVYWFPDSSALTETALPDALDIAFVLPPLALVPGQFSDLPDYGEAQAHCGLPADDEETWDACQALRTEDFSDDVRIKLLGYADEIQDDMTEQCALIAHGYSVGDGYPELPDAVQAEITADAADWVLLFQLDSVDTDDFELMFGDCGRIYFFIRKEDLAARRFDRIWLILQCC